MTEIYKKSTLEVTVMPDLGDYFFVRDPACNYCIFFIIDDNGIDPAYYGCMSVSVIIQSTNTTEEIAQKISDTLAATNQFETEVSGNLVTVTCLREGECDGVIDNNTSFTITQLN